MKKILIVGLALIFASPSLSQSYVEENARDTICEWYYKKQRGIEKCHIIAMGTHAMGDLVLMFTINNMVISLIENEEKHYKKAEIGSGGFWNFKPRWRGTYKDKYEFIGDPETSPISVNTITLNNGYTVKLVY